MRRCLSFLWLLAGPIASPSAFSNPKEKTTCSTCPKWPTSSRMSQHRLNRWDSLQFCGEATSTANNSECGTRLAINCKGRSRAINCKNCPASAGTGSTASPRKTPAPRACTESTLTGHTSTALRWEYPKAARTLPRCGHPQRTAWRDRQRPGLQQEAGRTGTVQLRAFRLQPNHTYSATSCWTWWQRQRPRTAHARRRACCAASGRHRRTTPDEHRLSSLQRCGHQGITKMLRGRHHPHRRHRSRLPLTFSSMTNSRAIPR